VAGIHQRKVKRDHTFDVSKGHGIHDQNLTQTVNGPICAMLKNLSAATCKKIFIYGSEVETSENCE
jgi:hypothetical protein